MQEFVFEPKKNKIYPHVKEDAEDKEGRERELLEHLMQLDIVKKAKLSNLDLGAVRLYRADVFHPAPFLLHTQHPRLFLAMERKRNSESSF